MFLSIILLLFLVSLVNKKSPTRSTEISSFSINYVYIYIYIILHNNQYIYTPTINPRVVGVLLNQLSDLLGFLIYSLFVPWQFPHFFHGFPHLFHGFPHFSMVFPHCSMVFLIFPLFFLIVPWFFSFFHGFSEQNPGILRATGPTPRHQSLNRLQQLTELQTLQRFAATASAAQLDVAKWDDFLPHHVVYQPVNRVYSGLSLMVNRVH